MIYIGIDPGLKGGIAFLIQCCSHAVTLSMPIEGKDVDISTLRAQVSAYSSEPRHVFLERAQAFPKQGVVSSFNYGRLSGMIEGCVRALGIPVTLVHPAVWHRSMLQGVPKDLPPKQRALVAAERLFPNVDLRANAKAKKPHDGLVDSLLIAEYGRRQLNGGA